MAKAKNNAEESREVALREQSTAVSTDVLSMMQEDAGSGFEDANRDAFTIPRLVMLQALSPECQPGHARYLDDAKPGLILHSITKELLTSVDVVPVHFVQSFTEWVPRDAGGGFRGERSYAEGKPLFDKHRTEKGFALLPNGNQLRDFRNHFLLLVREDGQFEPIVLTLTSTQTRKSSDWNSLMQRSRPAGFPAHALAPSYSFIWRLSPVLETKKENRWFGWRIDRLRTNNDSNLILAARAFKQQIRGQTINVDYADGAAEGETYSDDSDRM